MRKLFAVGLLAVCGTVNAASLPFLQDNYEKALADARQRNLPLFVEVWAPW